MAHKLPPLPYAYEALEPHISTETLRYHHSKHHLGYVEKLNKLIENTEFDKVPLEEIIMRAPPGPIFNNAAQVWNHSFYWQCLRPEGDADPRNPLEKALSDSFESVEQFRDEFDHAATTLFGSGWVWLVKEADGSLAIASTGDADNPMVRGARPLLTCDVWEHAYYIDYRNDKAAYLEAFWSLVNWDFIAQNLAHGRLPESSPA